MFKYIRLKCPVEISIKAFVLFIFFFSSSNHVNAKTEHRVYDWRLWPNDINKSVQLENASSEDNLYVGKKLTCKEVVPSLSLYAYVPMGGDKSYRIKFAYKLNEVQMTGNTPKTRLNFSNGSGGNGSLGSTAISWNVVNGKGDWHEFSAEVRTPANTSTCQFVIVEAEKLKGSILLANFDIEEVKDTFQIHKTGVAPDIDGRLSEECWARAEVLEFFYNIETSCVPARKQTKARVCFDDNNLYIAFENIEQEMNELKVCGAEKDGEDQPLWKGDCNDIFIKAPNGSVLQFVGNAASGRYDGRLYQVAAGDPYKSDGKCNYEWKMKGACEKNTWTTEFSIPFKNFNVQPEQGQVWRMNFAREKAGKHPEYSHWNRSGKTFFNPDKYSFLKFEGEKAILSRYTEPNSKHTFVTHRKKPQFLALQDPKGAMDYKSFYQPQGADYDTLESRLKDAGNCGFIAYFLPWLPPGGMRDLIKMFEKYHTGALLWIHSSDRIRDAQKLGSHFPSDPATPEYTQGVKEFLTKFASENKAVIPYVNFIYGKDEPENQIEETYSAKLHPGLKDDFEKISAQIKNTYGFGKFGLYDPVGEISPSRPFERIAFWRWWNANFRRSYIEQYNTVKQLFPSINYIGANLNNCGYMSPIDASIGTDISPWLGIDAYPGSAADNGGMPRAVYHVGYTVKYTSDIASEAGILALLQSFPYGGLTPTPAMLREWGSQALKNGAVGIFWWAEGNSYTRLPDCYKEAMRLSKILKNARKLNIPIDTKTAIFLSYPTMWGMDDKMGHAHYSLYVILGERLKSWFRFVSEGTLQRNPGQLDKFSILYVPRLTYTDEATADKIIRFVENGGTLVVFDPEILSWDMSGKSLANKRTELLGGALDERRPASNMNLTMASLGLPLDSKLLLSPELNLPSANGVRAFNITVPDGAEIIARYPDGKAAAYMRAKGKGKVLYFAAQPFGNSDLAMDDHNWYMLIKNMAESVGEKTDIPIWDFEFPKAADDMASEL